MLDSYPRGLQLFPGRLTFQEDAVCISGSIVQSFLRFAFGHLYLFSAIQHVLLGAIEMNQFLIIKLIILIEATDLLGQLKVLPH